MADPKRSTVEELREAWPNDSIRLKGETHHGNCWKYHGACAVRVALDLLAEAQRDTERKK